MADPVIDSLNDELRAVMAALNDAHHPVYPASDRRLAELEARVEALRASIGARKAELRAA